MTKREQTGPTDLAQTKPAKPTYAVRCQMNQLEKYLVETTLHNAAHKLDDLFSLIVSEF